MSARMSIGTVGAGGRGGGSSLDGHLRRSIASPLLHWANPLEGGGGSRECCCPFHSTHVHCVGRDKEEARCARLVHFACGDQDTHRMHFKQHYFSQHVGIDIGYSIYLVELF